MQFSVNKDLSYLIFRGLFTLRFVAVAMVVAMVFCAGLLFYKKIKKIGILCRTALGSEGI